MKKIKNNQEIIKFSIEIWDKRRLHGIRRIIDLDAIWAIHGNKQRLHVFKPFEKASDQDISWHI